MAENNLIFGIGMLNAWQIKKPVLSPKIFKSGNMRKYNNKSLFREDLKQVEWRTIFDTYTDDPFGMASIFQEIFTTERKSSSIILIY